MIEHALIFSAGRGERLYPYTKNCPKALLDVRGIPVLFWHIEKLHTLNIKTIFINHAYLGWQIKAHVRHAFPHLDIQFLPEPPGGLETGGTLGFFKHRLMHENSNLLCINADIYCDYTYDLNTVIQPTMMGKLILLPKENAAMKGNFNLDKEGYIQNSQNPKYVFAGIAYYNHLALQELPLGRYSIRDYLMKWSSQKQLVGEVHQSHWCDIGSIDTWLKMR